MTDRANEELSREYRAFLARHRGDDEPMIRDTLTGATIAVTHRLKPGVCAMQNAPRIIIEIAEGENLTVHLSDEQADWLVTLIQQHREAAKAEYIAALGTSMRSWVRQVAALASDNLIVEERP